MAGAGGGAGGWGPSPLTPGAREQLPNSHRRAGLTGGAAGRAPQPANDLLPFPHPPGLAPSPTPLQSGTLSPPAPACTPYTDNPRRGTVEAGLLVGVSGRLPLSRAPPEFRTQLALEAEKNIRTTTNGVAERTRAQARLRLPQLERSPGPAIGSRDLSLAAAASGQGPRGDWFRPGAKCNAGKAEAVTQAAGCYFRGLGAARPAFLSPKGRPPAASRRCSCAGEYKERRAGLTQGWGLALPAEGRPSRSFAGRRARGFRETSASHEPAGLSAGDSGAARQSGAKGQTRARGVRLPELLIGR